MPTEFNQAAPIDRFKQLIVDKVMETNDIALLDVIFQLLVFDSRC